MIDHPYSAAYRKTVQAAEEVQRKVEQETCRTVTLLKGEHRHLSELSETQVRNLLYQYWRDTKSYAYEFEKLDVRGFLLWANSTPIERIQQR